MGSRDHFVSRLLAQAKERSATYAVPADPRVAYETP